METLFLIILSAVFIGISYNFWVIFSRAKRERESFERNLRVGDRVRYFSTHEIHYSKIKRMDKSLDLVELENGEFKNLKQILS